MNDSYTMFTQVPIIPVIAIEHLEDAVPLAKALLAGGAH
jgi:2-keto-3-deoxy-6-phosphogluconate aldolase